MCDSIGFEDVGRFSGGEAVGCMSARCLSGSEGEGGGERTRRGRGLGRSR